MHDYRQADLPPRVRALCDLAVQMTHGPASVRGEDIEALRRLGWSDAGIHDAIQVVAYFNYINRVADAVGIDDEPEWGPR
ncbi:MAG TPA: hypothetical protein VE644_08470 [Gaiellaceae bacterium]|jgi:uncharacterized peroxidase-related enzyme|nr:hypothetical protein [Gaiellaceae bacterium]